MKSIIVFLWILGISVCLFSCKDMDHAYQEYIVPNGLTYPGAAKNPVVLPGHNRVKLVWLRGNDPKVVKATVYWNNYTDSIVNIPMNSDTISCSIEPLLENTYTFVIKTYDSDNNVSIPVQVSGRSYGNVYMLSLTNPALTSFHYSDGVWNVVPGRLSASSGAIFTELQYQTDGGTTKTVKLATSEAEHTILDHAGSKTLYKYRTAFLPDPLSIDTFYSNYAEGIIPSAKVRTTGWIPTADSKQNATTGPEFAIDGNTATAWHTLPTAAYPHWIAFDMGQSVNVDHVILTMRSASPNNTFKDFEIEGSMDGENWYNYGTFVFKSNSALIPQKFIIEGTPTMQHIRINCINSHANIYAVLAEFEVFEK